MIIYVREGDRTIPCEVEPNHTVGHVQEQAEQGFGLKGVLQFQDVALTELTEPLADVGVSAEVTIEYIVNVLHWKFARPSPVWKRSVERLGTIVGDNPLTIVEGSEGKKVIQPDSVGSNKTSDLLFMDESGFLPCGQKATFRMGEPGGYSHWIWACQESEADSADGRATAVQIHTAGVHTVIFNEEGITLSAQGKDKKEKVEYLWDKGQRIVVGVYLYNPRCFIELLDDPH
eukprot:Hpha_TRINITY_DN12445_c0_g1::TRINITY_DN12445_c0_g1_i1::g.42753::m.42753